MLAKLLIAAALAGLVVASASGATSTRGAAQQAGETSQLLMPGVSYLRQVDFTPRGPVVLDVVIAPRPDGSLYTLAPVLSNNALTGTERLTDVEQRLSGAATVVGVNGDFFRANPGNPSGILIQGGALESPPATSRSSLAIAADGTLSVATVGFDGSWRGTDQRRPLDLNEPPVKGHTTLYTPAWGATTPQEKGVVEDVIGALPAATPNTPLSGTVTSVTAAGGTPIPPGGAVLVARGAQAPHLTAEAPAGTAVEIRLTLTPSWSGVPGAIGGGPLLVADGRPVFDAKESFAATTLNQRNARSAIGQLADGRLLLVTVEGGSPAYSVGMTNYELGVALARLGARTAMGLGTGGTASLSFDGTLLSRPSFAVEQPLADGLVLSYTGVYAAQPSAATLSPNGDGVDDTETFAYKLVRPSHLVATLTGPNGSVRTLAGDDEQPGVHTLAWDGRNADGSPAAEGTWRFDVTATDDLGRTTTAERDVSLNDTLGTLAVAPAAAHLAPAAKSVVTATFQLQHAARIVVTVESHASGAVIATLLNRDLQPGPQSVTWDGRAWTGKLAFTGAYDLRVTATNDVGKVSLVAPFTARR